MENVEEGAIASERSEVERSGMVTARGTGDGLVIRLDGSVEPLELREALADFVSSRRAFLEGHQVALEWVEVMPERAIIDLLTDFLTKEFSLSVKESRFKDLKRAGKSGSSRSTASRAGGFNEQKDLKEQAASPILSIRRLNQGRDLSPEQHKPDKKVSLFDGIDVMNLPDDYRDVQSRDSQSPDIRARDVPAHYSTGTMHPDRYGSDSFAREKAKAVVNPLLWDDPDARIINATLRSGQRVESDHSIIVRGDVNSGAEVIAGGDIIVLGTLRGVAHAGAFDDTGGGRSIIALSLQPTQLRIGSLISRGKSNASASDSSLGIELARIEGNIIVVEPYQVRSGSRRG